MQLDRPDADWSLTELTGLKRDNHAYGGSLETLSHLYGRPKRDVDHALWALLGASAEVAMIRLGRAAR